MTTFLLAGVSVAAVGHSVVPCGAGRYAKCCGDGICNGSEDEITCLADCPGVTTAEMCGEEVRDELDDALTLGPLSDEPPHRLHA